MNKLKTKEWIAVGVAVIFISYIFFPDTFIGLLTPNMDNQPEVRGAQTSGVEARDEVVGNGTAAEAGDVITAHYVGRLSSGEIFESSYAGSPINFTLGVGQVIRGWDEGILGMKEGGKRTLTISPEYGYGSQGVGPIPPNSTLVFEVELIKVDKAR